MVKSWQNGWLFGWYRLPVWTRRNQAIAALVSNNSIHTIIGKYLEHTFISPAAGCLGMLVNKMSPRKKLFPVDLDDEVQVFGPLRDNLGNVLRAHFLVVDAPIKLTPWRTRGRSNNPGRFLFVNKSFSELAVAFVVEVPGLSVGFSGP